MHKDKLAIFDLDGTLFDTKNVNYLSYSKALAECGFASDIDYKYYCDFCNGNSYKTFLPKIVPSISADDMTRVHNAKKAFYRDFLGKAKMNAHLFAFIDAIKEKYQVALVTTASRENVEDILNYFDVSSHFDIRITQEDVTRTKPDPECFELAVKMAGVEKKDAIIFEDSIEGLNAAEASGIQYVKVYGYN